MLHVHVHILYTDLSTLLFHCSLAYDRWSPQATKLEGSDEFEELQEAREVELQAFVPSSRATEADRTGDMRSMERKLDRVLYLLVKKPRKEHVWQMPQGGIEEQESLVEVRSVIYILEVFCESSLQ